MGVNPAWHKDPRKWGPLEFIAAVDIGPSDSYTPKPKGYRVRPSLTSALPRCRRPADKSELQRSAKIPVHPMLKENLFVLTHAFPPLMVHQLGLQIADRVLPRRFRRNRYKMTAAWLFYQAAFIHYAINMVKRMHYWCVSVCLEQRGVPLNGRKIGWSTMVPLTKRTAPGT